MADGSDLPPRSQPDAFFHSTNLANLESLRNLLNNDRSGIDHQRALRALEQEMSERSAEAGMTTHERRRRDLDTHLQDHEASTTSDVLPASNSPSSLLRSRRRAFRPSQRLQRHREAYAHEQATRSGVPRSETSGDYTSLAAPAPSTPPTFTEATLDELLTESQLNRDQRYRSKRRKLDDGTYNDESKFHQYGDKGRVTPGPLKLDIVNCDGGEYSDGVPTGTVQYVLQDDETVYSTKGHRCNILFKHAGGMPFSLTKIVFKAPKTGFDAPLQEGMIFVAMNDEKLLERTSQYEARYPSTSYGAGWYSRRHDNWRPSQEYLNSTRPPLHALERRHFREAYDYRQLPQYGESSLESDTMLVPGFAVTFSDPSDSEEAATSRSVRSPRRWRDSASDYPPRTYADRYRPSYSNAPAYVELSGTSSESEDDEHLYQEQAARDDRDLHDAIARQRQMLDRLHMAHERGTWHSSVRDELEFGQESHRFVNSRVLTPPRGELRDQGHDEYPTSRAAPASNSNSSKAGALSIRDTGSSSSSDVLVPHARFFIHRHKSAITVNFDPPVSGRYLLIKLWAPCPKINIDIQSIIAHGYGGPRFFPSREMQ